MLKVEFFCCAGNLTGLQEVVNDFIENHNVKDIKMSATSGDVVVMVIYEDGHKIPVIGGYDSKGNLLRGFDDIYKGENQ